MDIFARQRLMFSDDEMNKIRDMVVLIAGAGGLGTHQATELVRIGVKKIYILDFDQIEPSNLNRQILYGKQDTGKNKAVVAKSRLQEFGLETEVVGITADLADLQEDILQEVDIIFDALDNYPGRYKLENLAQKYRIPLIHGGINGWYGQVTTIVPEKTPSLQEIFGPREFDTGNEIPSFSPVIAVVAAIQVLEGVKIYLGKEDVLVNRLLIIDFNSYSFEFINLS